MDNKPRLLIVDDEVNILNALRRLLRKEGYEIQTAGSGEEGIELLQDGGVDLIISDQRMPGMRGVEFLEKAQHICPESARMILSGYTDLESITEAINRGHVYKFLLKPWEDEELKSTIREALEVARLHRENARLNDELKKKNEELQWLNENLAEEVSRRTQELELRNMALEKYQYILHQMPVGVVGAGDDGRIAFVNKWAGDHLCLAMGLLGQRLERAFGGQIATACSELSKDNPVFTVTPEQESLANVAKVLGSLVRYREGPSGYLLIFVGI